LPEINGFPTWSQKKKPTNPWSYKVSQELEFVNIEGLCPFDISLSKVSKTKDVLQGF